MKIAFNKYENLVTGDTFFSLKEDAVKRIVDGVEFIEVTSDINNINKTTVFMVSANNLKYIGETSRELPKE